MQILVMSCQDPAIKQGREKSDENRWKYDDQADVTQLYTPLNQSYPTLTNPHKWLEIWLRYAALTTQSRSRKLGAKIGKKEVKHGKTSTCLPKDVMATTVYEEPYLQFQT